MNEQAQLSLNAAKTGVEEAINRIPPDAWPMIDIMFKIVIVLAAIWVFLSLIAWWRRRAYNLTVASTARKSKKAQPDFLNVDKKAREKAVDRGESHEETLDERDREEAAAALKAAKGPVTFAQRIASVAAAGMSVFTLLTAIAGTVVNIGRMDGYVADLTAAGKVQYLLEEHTLGVIVAVLVVAYHIWKYFSDKKWKEA